MTDKFDVTLEWGHAGVSLLQSDSDVVIVVDVLSFCTSVDIAVARGALIYPYSLEANVDHFATVRGAKVAVARGSAGYSLSPASLLNIEPETRLILPSPNGSALCKAITDAPVLAGCLRNARAVAKAARAIGATVAVIPAGEKWSDGTIRFAIEDYVGAGAIVSELEGYKSLEAQAAEAAFLRMASGNYVVMMERSLSGQELIKRGFDFDIHLAAELNSSTCAPVMAENAFLPFAE